jgi:hypothetical protein
VVDKSDGQQMPDGTSTSTKFLPEGTGNPEAAVRNQGGFNNGRTERNYY